MFYHEGLSKTILRHFRKVYSIKKLMKILIQIWNEQIESKAIVDLNKGSSPNFATNIKKFKQFNYLLFPLKSPEILCCPDEFRGDRT